VSVALLLLLVLVVGARVLVPRRVATQLALVATLALHHRGGLRLGVAL
jgi:hypothetical protein